MKFSNLSFALFGLMLALGTGIVASGTDGQKAQSTVQSSNAAAPDSVYASDDICQLCHSELWEKHFASTPHRALLSGDQHGCQGCHGPGQAHVDSGGDLSKIVRFSQLNPVQSAAICTKCHQASLETQNFSKSAHLANGLTCTSCHDPHNSPDVNFLLKQKQTELCFSCHKTKQAEFARPYRHRVDSGLILCSD